MRVVEQIQRLQGNELTVLITGESGTGKELVARAIHVGSLRSSAVFLPYNCTTTTRELADSQLFGHRRGSFTGAVNDQLGLVRTAAGGTLFLDEIGDLPIDVQPKLLRFLEQGEIMPVGDTRPQRVDVRVIAATNADLEQRVAEGKFREDLYYRLTVIRILIPPLRDRREEIPHLTSLFLREASERLSKPDVFLTPETLELLAQYWWPGNVRQLRNEIQRVVALSHPGRGIGPENLSPEITSAERQQDARGAPSCDGAHARHIPGRCRRWPRAGDHRSDAPPEQRQHLGGRPGARADPQGPLPETPTPRLRNRPARGHRDLLQGGPMTLRVAGRQNTELLGGFGFWEFARASQIASYTNAKSLAFKAHKSCNSSKISAILGIGICPKTTKDMRFTDGPCNNYLLPLRSRIPSSQLESLNGYLVSSYVAVLTTLRHAAVFPYKVI